MLALLALALSLGLSAGASFDYNYAGDHGPLDWGEEVRACSSKVRQSPIDLQAFKSQVYLNMPDLSLSGYDVKVAGQALKNNGHSVVAAISPKLRSSADIGMSGADFVEDGYWLHSFHFHWARNNATGSEHTLSGLHYPLELHLVHVRKDLTELGQALDKPDGLAVLGVFFKLVPNHLPNQSPRELPLDPFVKALAGASSGKGANGTAGTFSLNSLVPANYQSFFRYQGSLTTPPCSEAVVWTVLTEPLLVSAAQLAAFRKVKLPRVDGGFDSENFRPVQPLGSRTVFLRSNQIKVHDPHSAADKPLVVGILSGLCLLASLARL